MTILTFTNAATRAGKRQLASSIHQCALLTGSKSIGDNWIQQQQQPLFDSRRFLSSLPSSTLSPPPLLLGWNGPQPATTSQKKKGKSKVWRPPVLFPFKVDRTNDITPVSSIEEAVEKINAHYSNDNRFVGGMGESDPGVALVSFSPSRDIIDDPESIQTLIEAVKEERHGVPFHLYTTGIPVRGYMDDQDWDVWKQVPLESWQVSLYAGTPPEYNQVANVPELLEEEDDDENYIVFGTVCGFIGGAVDSEMPVEAIVVRSQAIRGREMARDLGVRQTHIAVL
ncbi:hypothetical protein ACA910_015157 [Epithemia clementina (nom. ined.)]